MSSVTKKTLITLLLVTSGASANQAISPLLDHQLRTIQKNEYLSYDTNMPTRLNFKNDSEYDVIAVLKYLRKDPNTQQYVSKKERFRLNIGQSKFFTMQKEDVRVQLIADTSEGNQKSAYFKMNLCSYNNNYYTSKETPWAYQKDITFVGKRYNAAIIYPDLTYNDYKIQSLPEDKQCWVEPDALGVIVYEDWYQQGFSFLIQEDMNDLGFFNDKISSYDIPKDVTVIFYEGKDYTGNYYTRTESSHSDSDLTDKIKSIRVRKTTENQDKHN